MRSCVFLLCLLVSFPLSQGQSGECEESELGYACKKTMTDYYDLHWSLGPTTSGPEAEAGEIAIAMVGQTAGWVGFAFAEEAGSMVPADFVIGWISGGEAVVTPYRSEIRSITPADEDDEVTLLRTAGSQERRGEERYTTIEFVRSLTDGTTEIVLDEEIPVNVAIGPEDELGIHSDRLPTTVTLNLAEEGSTDAPALQPAEEETPSVSAPAPEIDSVPAPEPSAEEPTAAEDGGCTPSDLDFDCMTEAGDVTVHWTVGPADERGEVPELEEGQIGMAISASTEGWVAVSFAQEAGVMFPADVILGWVDGDDFTIGTYAIDERNIEEADETNEIGLSPISGSEEDGVTTLLFVLDGTFTFDVDLEEDVDMNWAVGPADELVIHLERGSFSLNFLSGGGGEESAREPEDVEVMPTVTETDGGCEPSSLDYDCMVPAGDVTVHWTVGPADERGEVPELEEAQIGMAISASTDGWVGVSFAEAAGSMAPADVILGWMDGSDAVIKAYAISGRSISEGEETTGIGLTPVSGSEEGGVTTLHFVLDGTFTFPVDLQQDVSMNWGVGSADSLVQHDTRGSFSLNFFSGASASQDRSLKYYRAHGACMIIAWIGLAPFGLLVARNKYAFAGLFEGAWFQLHRAVQITALLFMVCGLIIALAEFDDPASEEGKRHRRVGISILTIGLVQGFIPFFRPNHESDYRFIFNYVHWWLGRGSVVLGISTVFLGIKAFDILNDDHVDQWWITCVVILGVYFAFAAVGELTISMKRAEEDKMKHKKEDMPATPTRLEMS